MDKRPYAVTAILSLPVHEEKSKECSMLSNIIEELEAANTVETALSKYKPIIGCSLDMEDDPIAGIGVEKLAQSIYQLESFKKTLNRSDCGSVELQEAIHYILMVTKQVLFSKIKE